MFLLMTVFKTGRRKIAQKGFKRSYAGLSYMHNVGTEPLKALTLGKLLEITANKYPEREVVVSRHQNQRVTFQEVLSQADKLAAGFRELGLKKGDRLGIWAPNIAEWVTTMMASARAGLVLVALNPAYQANELSYCLNKVGVKALVCSHKVKKLDFYHTLTEIVPELPESDPGKLNSKHVPSLKSVVMITNDTCKGTYNYNELMNLASENSVQSISKNQHLIQPDSNFNIQFTSGTTGQPKATLITHFNIVNNAYQVGKRNELDRKHHKICVQVPLFHAFGIVISVWTSIYFGATMVLPSPTYNPLDNLNAISQEGYLNDNRCTSVYGTPTMYVDLVNIQKQHQADVNPEIAVSGGAPCSPELFKQMQQFLKVKKVKSVYGLTEATAVIFQNLPINEDEYKLTATVGYVGEHLEVKVVDGDDHMVPLGTPGELCVRGYSTMLGYWEDEAKTKEVLGADGWLKTGDQFVLQEDGYGRIVGRLKDMIIRGGENIFPKEIEDFLNTHPDVLESHVIGLTHGRLGEEVCACVRLQKGAELSHDSLVEFCKGKLASYKIPSQLKIVDSFPKTVSGKIQKYLLKEKYEKNK